MTNKPSSLPTMKYIRTILSSLAMLLAVAGAVSPSIAASPTVPIVSPILVSADVTMAQFRAFLDEGKEIYGNCNRAIECTNDCKRAGGSTHSYRTQCGYYNACMK